MVEEKETQMLSNLWKSMTFTTQDSKPCLTDSRAKHVNSPHHCICHVKDPREQMVCIALHVWLIIQLC